MCESVQQKLGHTKVWCHTRLTGLREGPFQNFGVSNGNRYRGRQYITVSPFFGEFKTDHFFEHINALKKVAPEYLI